MRGPAEPALHGDKQKLLSKWDIIPLPLPTIATKLCVVDLAESDVIATEILAVSKPNLSTLPTSILETPTDIYGALQSRGNLCVARLAPVVCNLTLLYPNNLSALNFSRISGTANHWTRCLKRPQDEYDVLQKWQPRLATLPVILPASTKLNSPASQPVWRRANAMCGQR